MDELSQLIEFIASNFKEDSRILILLPEGLSLVEKLFEIGFTRLYALSSSKDVYNMPYNYRIRYLYCNSDATHFPPKFFDCCIALGNISSRKVGYLIEILKNNGTLICSERYSDLLHQRGESVINSIRAYSFSSRHNTYPEVKDIELLSYSSGRGGISEYTHLLRSRLATKYRTEVIGSVEESRSDTVIIEYARGLALKNITRDVEYLVSKGKRVFVEVHDSLKGLGKDKVEWLEQRCTLLYRSNESGEYDGVHRYYIMPHISYTNVEPLEKYSDTELYLGTFGFAGRYKRFDLLARVAKKLKLPIKMMISINKEVESRNYLQSITSLEKILGKSLGENSEVEKDGVYVRTGFFELEDIRKEMGECSHILFAHRSNTYYHSGTMTLAKRFNRPVIACDSFQSRQAQCVRVDSFIKLIDFRDELLALGSSLLRNRKESFGILKYMYKVLFGKEIDKEFLNEHISTLSMDDDGFYYLLSALQTNT